MESCPEEWPTDLRAHPRSTSAASGRAKRPTRPGEHAYLLRGLHGELLEIVDGWPTASRVHFQKYISCSSCVKVPPAYGNRMEDCREEWPTDFWAACLFA